MKEKEDIIRNYIEGYNNFDVSRMVQDFDKKVIFENIQNGEVTMTLNGIDEFITQAEAAKSYFLERMQKIKVFRHENDKTEIEVEYTAVLAIDFPNGLKKGQKIKLLGKSVFEFQNEKIIRLTDLS
ncbi:hypothetical protein SAMN00777080_2497 [Aquiflexum balticum DSM 16537]|uniref:SnoaL-like domain-containing protein n=1 Tax=Aquiflexum balticum DSM 16537 TaxID=758820 RepID=A0A1W2H534_9BACT|nr:nuclear transport factor 2 family protein [Aquiflexum balticum]SMD43884.1 hypothetical protein SAMN00777080_2497 [Aquiflexum balticum DSM 16537]